MYSNVKRWTIASHKKQCELSYTEAMMWTMEKGVGSSMYGEYAFPIQKEDNFVIRTTYVS